MPIPYRARSRLFPISPSHSKRVSISRNHWSASTPKPHQVIEMFIHLAVRENPVAGRNSERQCVAEPVAATHGAKVHCFGRPTCRASGSNTIFRRIKMSPTKKCDARESFNVWKNVNTSWRRRYPMQKWIQWHALNRRKEHAANQIFFICLVFVESRN